MGINPEADFGVDRRRSQGKGTMLILDLKETKNFPAETRLGFWAFDPDNMNEDIAKMFKNRATTYAVRRKDEISAAWNEKSFFVRAFNDADRSLLHDLYKAHGSNDLAVGLCAGGPFAGGPLNLCIISRIPETLLNAIKQADIDHQELLAAAQATGIEDQLKNAGMDYFALKPKWIKDFKSLVHRENEGPPSERSEYPVIFWLNPRNQRVNSSGWFTVEELTDWCAGKGPVIVKETQDA